MLIMKRPFPEEIFWAHRKRQSPGTAASSWKMGKFLPRAGL